MVFPEQVLYLREKVFQCAPVAGFLLFLFFWQGLHLLVLDLLELELRKQALQLRLPRVILFIQIFFLLLESRLPFVDHLLQDAQLALDLPLVVLLTNLVKRPLIVDLAVVIREAVETSITLFWLLEKVLRL